MKTLSAIVIKLLERCPLKYSLVHSLVSVIPQKLVSNSTEAQVKFEQLLQILLNGKWCSAVVLVGILSSIMFYQYLVRVSLSL